MAFKGFDPPSFGSQRRKQLREAFERALSLAKERHVDALCIAGDLYEDGLAGPDAAHYVCRKLHELSPIRVFISPGNHDPYSATSLYRLLEPLPPNITLFRRRQFSKAPLCEGLTLWGSGHERALDRDPILRDFCCAGAGTHLLLFHGSDRDRVPPNKETIAPFSAAEIEQAGAAHAMVGHYHGQSQFGRYAYPGSLEPHNFMQAGRHTAALVVVQDGRVNVEFIDINQTRYVEAELGVEDVGDSRQLADAAFAKLRTIVPEPGKVFCRLHLRGQAAATLELDAAALQAELNAGFPGTQLIDEVSAFDLEAIAAETSTVRAEFVKTIARRIEAASDGDERALLAQARNYGLAAFAGLSLRA